MSDERPKPESTDGPGNVSVDEPTEPALSGDDRDAFDEQADDDGDSGSSDDTSDDTSDDEDG